MEKLVTGHDDQDAELLTRLENCRVEVVQAAIDRQEAEHKARLINQPMGSNFDGNCGG